MGRLVMCKMCIEKGLNNWIEVFALKPVPLVLQS